MKVQTIKTQEVDVRDLAKALVAEGPEVFAEFWGAFESAMRQAEIDKDALLPWVEAMTNQGFGRGAPMIREMSELMGYVHLRKRVEGKKNAG